MNPNMEEIQAVIQAVANGQALDQFDPGMISAAKQFSAMKANELNEFASEAFGLNLMGSDLPQLPENEEELQLHMQLNYKQAVEIAEEQANQLEPPKIYVPGIKLLRL